MVPLSNTFRGSSGFRALGEPCTHQGPNDLAGGRRRLYRFSPGIGQQGLRSGRDLYPAFPEQGEPVQGRLPMQWTFPFRDCISERQIHDLERRFFTGESDSRLQRYAQRDIQ
jgi:hypothetical protein